MSFASITWRGKSVQIEFEWVEPASGNATLVFLHEGLGSVAMWKDFPTRLCERMGLPGLVYSRPGYGQSTPRDPAAYWRPDFMHQQAHEVLPALLQALQVEQPIWLLGHSDGGSIALLHAAKFVVQGLVVMAPHIMVEDISITSIQQARVAYEQGDLRSKLSRYHADVDSAFWGWNRVWLSPEFRSWNVTQELQTITAPVLAIQGSDDEYGTMAQVHGIAQQLPQAQVLELPSCAHSPHKDQPEWVIEAVSHFVQAHTSP